MLLPFPSTPFFRFSRFRDNKITETLLLNLLQKNRSSLNLKYTLLNKSLTDVFNINPL